MAVRQDLQRTNDGEYAVIQMEGPGPPYYFTAMTALPVRKYSVPLAIAGVAIA